MSTLRICRIHGGVVKYLSKNPTRPSLAEWDFDGMITPEIRRQTALTILQGLLASGDFTMPPVCDPSDPEDEPMAIYDPHTGCVAINEALEMADEFLSKLEVIEDEESAKRN